MENDRTLLAILWLSSIVVTILIPIIVVYFLKKEKGELWEKHFKYMINFLLVELIGGIIATILAITIVGLIIAFPLAIALFIYYYAIIIIAVINLFQGKDEVPFVPEIIK